MTHIIDLRNGWPKGPGPMTPYVSTCPHCGLEFKLQVPILQFKSSDFDAWLADIVRHRTDCKTRAAIVSGLNEAGKHFLGIV